MKRLTSIGLGAAAVAVAVVSGFTLLANAWGPSGRSTFTLEKPASYVTFNSITNNNTEGDERYFVTAKAADNGKWADTTVVEDGKDYIVKMYVHNNAGANLNLVAENVKAFAYIENKGSQTQVSGKITSTNANPNAVWDETTFKSANGEEFTLSFVSGSAEYTNAKNGQARKFKLSNNLLNNGTALGYDQMDGKIPGCFQYSGVVTYKVRAAFKKKPVTPNPSYELQKQVQVEGSNTWSENVEMKAGQTVRYRLHFKNTGNVDLKDVVLKDVLPAGLTYVKGSSVNGDGKAVADGIIGNGLNYGTVKVGQEFNLYFKATVNKTDKCEKGKKLTNTVKTNPKYDVDTNGDGKADTTKEVGEKQDTADVTINCAKKTCDDFGGKEKPEGDYTEKKEFKGDDGETIICYVEKKVDCDDFGAKEKPEGEYTIEKKFTTTSGKTIVCYIKQTVIPATPSEGTPASLPKSGPAEIITSVIGLSSLGMASAYYVSSRKRLQ